MAEQKTTSSVSESMDLRDYLAALRRHRLLIAVVTAGVLAIVLLWSFQRTPVYVSQTKVLIKPITLNPTLDQGQTGRDLINPENQLLAVARAELPQLDPHGPHDLRHTFTTWLEDGGVPARVIDEPMGHQAGRRGKREGS